MSGETEKQVSGWTVDTLKEHLTEMIVGNDLRYEQRFKAAEQAVSAALAAQRDATSVAGIISEKRMDGLNELRGMAEDQSKVFTEYAKTYIPRGEAMAEVRSVQQNVDAALKLISALTDRMNMGAGEAKGTKDTKEASAAQMALIAGAVASIVSVVVPILLAFLRSAPH